MTKTNIKFLDLAHIDKWTREEKIANVILGLLLNNPLYSENMWFYLKDMAVSGQKTTLSEAIDALEKLIEEGLIKISFGGDLNAILKSTEKRSGD